MNLTKKEAQEIVKQYDLGGLVNFKLNPGGAVNYNYDFHTSKGDYMVRIISHKMTKWKRDKLSMEFDVLNFLKENKFPYEVPQPIKNQRGNYLLKLNGKYLWTYKKIPGEINYKFKNIKEVAKALATFHKFTKKYKVPREQGYHLLDFLNPNYKKIKEKISKLKNTDKVDKLVIKNIKLFESQLKRITKENYRKNLILTHSDFGIHNLLFEKDKVIAILDFDNLCISPRAKEIAYPIKRMCFIENKIDKRKVNLFLREYEKINKLRKKEKDSIIDMMILDSLNVFWWIYMEMKKNPEKRYSFLKKTIDKLKYFVKELK
jgi:Ser/Thr protein kinase RdoA (MazF antagonist)